MIARWEGNNVRGPETGEAEAGRAAGRAVVGGGREVTMVMGFISVFLFLGFGGKAIGISAIRGTGMFLLNSDSCSRCSSTLTRLA